MDVDLETPVNIIRKGIPRFKWWVAPLNMIFFSILISFYDLGIRINNPGIFPWSIWAIIGMWLIYFLGVALSHRPHDAWLIIPIFFILLSMFLASIDWAITDESNEILFKLSWSFYPITTILVLFVILPVITFTGRQSKRPLEMLREIIALEEQMVD
jgi:hypothetical protein